MPNTHVPLVSPSVLGITVKNFKKKKELFESHCDERGSANIQFMKGDEEEEDALFKEAAEWVENADLMLFASGAGMGVASGLKVYNDVAAVDAYKSRGLTYDELSRTKWLDEGSTEEDRRTFYGWWGSCFNTYRQLGPHKGFDILSGWRDALELTTAPGTLAGGFGPFFVFTSNVDHHSISSGMAGLDNCDEIHGQIEWWQCRDGCKDLTWRAPPYYRFKVDPDTMLASPQTHPNLTYCDDPIACKSFATPFPTCPECKGPARPAILMFDDLQWVCPRSGRYNDWKRAAVQFLSKNQHARLAIVEVGAGDRIPTVRHNSENLIQHLYEHAQLWEDPRNQDSPIKAKVIRINPDFERVNRIHFQHLQPYFISIKSGGLEALERIDYYIKQHKKK